MKTGVLLMNTGTPDAPSIESIRTYLREFLMDPAIIGAPRWIRRIIVSSIVAQQPQRTLARYQAFWTDEGSPFMLTCHKQAGLLQDRLDQRCSEKIEVVLAMRYGNPSIQQGLATLRSLGCRQVVILPAYPQQVNVCTGTCIKAVKDQLIEMAWSPEVIEVPFFYDLPSYRQALATQVRSAWQPRANARLVVSCHSTLLADIENGDPYKRQVEATAEALAKDLGLDRQVVLVSYQSRFDNRRWLGPFTEPTVIQLAQTHVTDLAVVCPVFTADCMETELEVARDLRRTFLEVADEGSSFTYVPCLNTNEGLIDTFIDAIERALNYIR